MKRISKREAGSLWNIAVEYAADCFNREAKLTPEEAFEKFRVRLETIAERREKRRS